jgi:hypothetical protein
MQENIYHREITEFFQFFSEWFDGSSPNTDEHYARIINVIPKDSTYINPEGKLIAGESYFRDDIRKTHDSLPELKMSMKNFRLQWETDDLALVIFEEWSQASVAVPGARLCSVIFRKNPATPNGIEWLHVHETLLQTLS